MAILVAAGGAALGSAVGLGWQAGWLVGSVVGTLLFPNRGPNVTTEGPRLGDLTVTSGAYGTPIAIAYGTMRMAGTVIWSAGIREQRSFQRSGGKGGGGSQTTVGYSYSASFAIALGAGPAEDVLRIWADGKLIFDKTGHSPDVARPDLRLRFHGGTEDQLPDPLIEAHEGAGRTPAHRGLCLLVFEDLPLADYGNRIPNITAEITFRRTTSQPYQLLDLITPEEGGLFSSYSRAELAVDWRRGYGYFLTSSSNAGAAGIHRFSLRTMIEDRQARMSDVTETLPNNFPKTLFCGPDSHLYLNTGGGNAHPILRIDPDSLREVGRFGSTGISTSNTTTRFAAASWMAGLSTIGQTGRRDFLLVGGMFTAVGLLRCDTMSYVWGAGQRVDEARVRGVAAGASGEDFAEGWAIGSGTNSNHAPVGIYRLRVAATAFYDAVSGRTIGVTWDKVAALSADAFDPAATGFHGGAGGLTYDPTDDGIIFQVRLSHGGTPGDVLAVKWRADVGPGGGIVWHTPVPSLINYEGPFFAQSRLVGQRWTLMRSTRVVQLDTATGAILLNELWPNAVSEYGAQVYDALSDTLLVHGNSGWARLFLNRGGGEGEALSAIVADLCARGGLGPGDIDVADLTATVPGYAIGRQTTVRGAIEPLAQAYFFDAAESDDVLRFRTRGRAAVATIDARDLIVLDDAQGETWRERRVQEMELPERVSVVHMDRDADYQQSTQAAKRVSLPLPTMHARSQASLELALALEATTAKRIAEMTLFAAWMERSTYEARLPPDWLRLDPTDVITVAFPNGTIFPTRLTRLEVGADLSIALTGVSQAAPTYTSQAIADGGSGYRPQHVAGAAATRLVLPDLPLLRDVDDTAGTGSRLYSLMGGFGAPGWPGAVLYRSADGTTWSQVGRGLSEAAWGAAGNALGSPRAPFATDEDNVLEVFMATGDDRLDSVTQEALVNGANAALLLKANGEPEVLQFREVTVNPTGSYTLRGLLRGRRGTDVFVHGHGVGDLFVLLEPETVETLVLALGDLGLLRAWKAVGFGELFEDTETLSRVHTGRDLMPYAPWNVRAQATGSNIILSWVRRTRIGGEWRDGTGTVPLAEAVEAYEVDILDGPGGGVLRTLTSTGPSVVYAHADIIADFGALPDTLTVAVHQMSAVVGRGFARTVTLEIP